MKDELKFPISGQKIIEVVEALPPSWGNIKARLHATDAMFKTGKYDLNIQATFSREPGYQSGYYPGGTFEQQYSHHEGPKKANPPDNFESDFLFSGKLPMAAYFAAVGTADWRTEVEYRESETNSRRRGLFEEGRRDLLKFLKEGYQGDFQIGSVMHPIMWHLPDDKLRHAEEISIIHHSGGLIHLYVNEELGGKPENVQFLVDLLK